MYAFVIMDKLNHCTAFKPRCSPWDNKYTHADIQVRSCGGRSDAIRDALWLPGVEELRFQGFKIREMRDQRGCSGAPPAGGSGHVQEEEEKKKKILQPSKHQKNQQVTKQTAVVSEGRLQSEALFLSACSQTDGFTCLFASLADRKLKQHHGTN